MLSTRPGDMIALGGLLLALVWSAFSLLIPTALVLADPTALSTPPAAGVVVIGDVHEAQVRAVCTTTVWSLTLAACLCSLLLPRRWGARILITLGGVSAAAATVSLFVPEAGQTSWHVASLGFVGAFALAGRSGERRPST